MARRVRSADDRRLAELIRRWTPLLALALLAAPALAVDAVDDRGRSVALARPAQRIVSLAPHITELLFAAGAGSKVVGAVEFSDYPEEARAIPRLGDAARIDMERVAELVPDLVVAWRSGNAAGDIERLERLGLPVFVTEPQSLAAIPRQIEQLGTLAGSPRFAARAALSLRRRIEALERQFQGRPQISVFYQVWPDPLMTVNGGHIISDAIRMCGGINPFAALEPIAPVLGREAVIAANPAVIIAATAGADDAAALGAWRRWGSLDAVRYGNLYTLPADELARATPRMLDGVARLCQALEEARGRAAGAGPEAAR